MINRFLRWAPHWRYGLPLIILLVASWWFGLPRPLFDTPVATVLEDRQGDLLSAQIAEDGQWRFPPPDSLSEKLTQAIIHFEDRRFYRHPGVDAIALGRAVRDNVAAGRIVSGGSTLTMQVVRLSQGNPPRTWLRKCWEILLALRLDLTYSKADILRLWAAHAPFGGNVVGVEAAAWRYFGKTHLRLSWAEAATLAVLPNSPALIHPGRNRAQLRRKRDRLLRLLHEFGKMTDTDLELALAEPLPEQPLELPRVATHLLERARQEHGPGRYRTNIDQSLQRRLRAIAERHQHELQGNRIHNLAVLVVDVETGAALSYLGNVTDNDAEYSPAVDIIRAPRSPGSLLKPLLFGLSLQDGLILPASLLPDVPSPFRDFRPANFEETYDGAVPANEALSRSLNVPMVHLLKEYSTERFHYALQKWNFRHIDRPAGHYGLSIVLGGCEVDLWEITGWYASMARMLNHYYPQQGRYRAADWHPPHYLQTAPIDRDTILSPYPRLLGAGAAYAVVEAMQEVRRPGTATGWREYRIGRRIAWKTGTSFGFRDAWAIGISPRYAVGVWVGNADGTGRPGLVGVRAAAPVLFDVFGALPADERPWFEPPYDEMRRTTVCAQSGYRALPICPTDSAWVPQSVLSGPSCTFHQVIHTDREGAFRTNLDCAAAEDVVARSWFVLPPLQAYYYRSLHPDYALLPPWRPGCTPTSVQDRPMQLIYPRRPSRIFVPRDLDGSPSATIFEVAHRDPEAVVFWHLDSEYLGSTRQFHTMKLRPPPGRHRIVLVDGAGNRLAQWFEVIE